MFAAVSCSTVAFKIRLMYGREIRRMERRYLLETHQFSAVPLYSTTLCAVNTTALAQHKLGRSGSFAGCAS